MIGYLASVAEFGVYAAALVGGIYVGAEALLRLAERPTSRCVARCRWPLRRCSGRCLERRDR